MDGLFSSPLFAKLGALILGEPPEETEEEQRVRVANQRQRELLAKSQRGVLLEDLDHSIQALARLIESGRQTKGHYTRRCVSADQHDPDSVDVAAAAATSSSGGAAMMESTDEKRHLLLNDDLAAVTLVCSALDRCVSYGLRTVDGDAAQTVKFFGLLKWTSTRVDVIRHKQMLDALHRAGGSGKRVCEVVTSSVEPELPRSVRGFLAAVRAANGLANVRTDEGKARAFLRQALNMHLLPACLSMVLAETNLDLLSSYYTDTALFRQRDDVKVFLHLLQPLDELPFAFLIDDLRLDAAPDDLPFATPLPRPRPQKPKKHAPKLIEPEDMVGGRVRLCEQDDETALLAAKLVSHHELRSTFDSLQGGNPLSDTLERAAQTQKLEDAAVAVLRFLELGYPEYDVFGTDLLDVLCNPFLSGMARFETALGLPDVVEACCCYLYDHLDTPGLFQVHLQADHVLELRDTIEDVGGFHKHMALDPHEVAALLFQYLWELPDAVLTEERMDNLLACSGGATRITQTTDSDVLDENAMHMDREECKMLIKVLINDLPWFCKPLLERVCHLVAAALEPEHAEKNGLTLYAIANTLAPLLLRKRHASRFREYDDVAVRKYPVGCQHANAVRYRLLPPDLAEHPLYPRAFASDHELERRAMRHAERDAQESARVVSLLLAEHAFILSDVRAEMQDRRASLQAKVLFLETLRFQMDKPIDIANPRHVRLLKQVWDGLLSSDDDNEDEASFMRAVPGHQEQDGRPDTQNEGDAEIEIDAAALLRSTRWRRSGFHTECPLGGFRGGGLLSLECLVYFLREYPDKARAMMERNALAGGSRYPFPVASINVMRMLMKLLMLDEVPETGSKLVLQVTPSKSAEAPTSATTTVLKLRIAERVSRTPFWHVFDDHDAFFKLHAMAFMLLDLHWLHSGATQMGFQPVLDATRRQMGWLLEQQPQSVEEMWATWMRVREQHAAHFTPSYANVTRATTSSESDALAAEIQRKYPTDSTAPVATAEAF